jgi:hypothetical protein
VSNVMGFFAGVGLFLAWMAIYDLVFGKVKR